MDKIIPTKLLKLSIAAGVVALFFGVSIALTRMPLTLFSPAADTGRTDTDAPLEMRRSPTDDWAFTDGGQQRAWLWDTPRAFNEDVARAWMQMAQQEQITTLSVNVSDIADIRELSNPAEREAEEARYQEQVRVLIGLAHEYGIAVEALAGDAVWGNSSHWYLPQLVLDFVISYNAQALPREKFSGIQFDIEPHNQEGYRERDIALILSEYMTLVRSLIRESARRAPDMGLGFAIPFWYDEDLPHAPALTFQGAHKPLAHHIMDMVSNHPHGYVAIMDYRNIAEGERGAIAEVQGEFEYAQRNQLPIGIVIGFEFVEGDPPYISFYGTTRDHFLRQKKLVMDAYQDHASYAGISVHDLKYFLQLIRP